MEIDSFSLGIFGFSAQIYNYGKDRASHRILTYLAGPVCNLSIALFFYFIGLREELIQINLALGILNLIPILPLDGGRILKEILKAVWGNKKASIFMIEFTKFTLIIISLVYSVAILKLKNIAILLLLVYLWWLYCIEDRKIQTLKRVYGIIEKGIEKK